MQDWMLYQKEQECQQLRQKLDEALTAHNELKVENALLQEKLHQQEQRMQHELKLIKIAAMQRRSAAPPATTRAIVSHNPDEWKDLPNDAFAFPVQSPQPTEQIEGPPPATEDMGVSAQQSIESSTASLDSDELKDGFDSNSVTWPSNAEQRRQTKPDTTYKHKMGPLTRNPPPPAKAPAPATAAPPAKPPVKPTFPLGKPPPSPRAVPRDIQVDGPPTVPLTENITFGTSSVQQRTQEIEKASTMLFPKKAVNGGVSFVDDSASVGQSVASSTFGEDRHKVHDQDILDPYGDKGHYTGVILRSTGMPHGAGRMLYQEDNRTYDGEWRHGRWHGFGRATFANGDSYEGEYRFDQRHGRGRYSWNDGRVYDGLFREDKRHGQGVFTWPDGAIYEGEFKNGQREGHGVYSFSDGGRYEGSWKDGRYNGFGICNWEDGRCYKGEWLNGMAHGKGIETFADGSVRHDGQWIEDQPIESDNLSTSF